MRYIVFVDGEFAGLAEFNRPKVQIKEWAEERQISTKSIEIYPFVGGEDGV
jgi:hypothetical protein